MSKLQARTFPSATKSKRFDLTSMIVKHKNSTLDIILKSSFTYKLNALKLLALPLPPPRPQPPPATTFRRFNAPAGDPGMHMPGMRPPKGVASALNKAKLKDFMQLGSFLMRRHRTLATRS